MYTLIDLRGFVMRSYFSGKDPDAILDKDTDKLINTAQYGYETFIERYLTNWLQKGESHKLIFVLEGGNDFRRLIYPEYKEGRGSEQSENQVEQINKASKMVSSLITDMGLTICRQKGAEADDLIAYLCKDLSGRKLVHTVDKDLTVLCALEETTVCYHSTKEGEIYYTDKVDDLPARFLTLQKSLVGDSSDNYKGVPGFGPAAWEGIVKDYGIDGLKELYRYVSKRTFDELKSEAEELEDKRLQKIYDNKEDWIKSYNLARLYPSLCNKVNGRTKNTVDWIKQIPKPEVYNDLIELFKGNAEVQDVVKALKPEYTLVTKGNERESLQEMKTLLKESCVVAWDFETYDAVQNENLRLASKDNNFVSVLDQRITGCSFAVGRSNHKVFYLSCFHADTENVPKESILDWIKLCEESGLEMVAQNSQFEAAVAKNDLGHDVMHMTDTSMFSKNLYEEESSGLKFLSKKFLNYNQTTYLETVGDKAGMHELTGEEVLNYGCDDSLVTASLLHLFWIQSELEGTREFITDYDCPSMHLLVDSFVEGCPIDLDRLNQLAKEDEVKEKELMDETRDLLSNHAKEVNEEAFRILSRELCQYSKMTMRDKGKSDEEIEKKSKEINEKLREDCVYVTPKEYKKRVEFIPTATQINKVLSVLGSEIRVDKLTAAGLTKTLVEAEMAGCNMEFWSKLGACAGTQLKQREGTEYDAFHDYCCDVLTEASEPVLVGTELNLDSPKQMVSLLYGMLSLPVRLRTPVKADSARDRLGLEGGPSTNEKAIQIAAAEDCEGENEWKRKVLLNIVEINKCRTRSKLYWIPYPLWADENNHIHPQIKQSATVTNRPTGTSPNLLQVSKKDGGHVRSIFKAGEDKAFVSIDFSGQELRITASVTEDPVMLDAYIGEQPKDLHSVTACAIAQPLLTRLHKHINLGSMPFDGKVLDYTYLRDVLDNADKEDPIRIALDRVRAASKTLNFGVVYGAGPTGIAMQLMIPTEVAQELTDALFSRYKRLPEWKEELWESARNKGYVETAYGSRRHCWPNIISSDGFTRSRMERQAANFVIQGTASDILKIVMTNAYRSKVFEETGATLLAPIYDEIAARVPVRNVVEYVIRMSDIMSVTTPGLKVPQVPEVSIGLDNWGYQKELGAYPSEEAIMGSLY